jgi:hypothetical protein
MIAILAPLVARAQPANMMEIMPRMIHAGDTNRPSLIQAQWEVSYAAPGEVDFRGTKSGDSDALNARLNLFAPLPLNRHWIVPLGLGTQNLFLDTVSGVPVPEEIHTLSLNSGLGRRLNDDWTIIGMASATLYKFSDVGGNDVGVSGGINAMWRYRPTVMLRFGLMVSPDSDIPVLPMAGVDWQINSEVNLRLLFPQPRFTYQPNEHWRFYTGMNLAGSTFRTSDTFGTSIGIPEYNDALGTYRDIRLGGGVGYQVNRRIGFEAEAGYSMWRQIEYTRIDETLRFDSAPYVRLAARIGF